MLPRAARDFGAPKYNHHGLPEEPGDQRSEGDGRRRERDAEARYAVDGEPGGLLDGRVGAEGGSKSVVHGLPPGEGGYHA